MTIKVENAGAIDTARNSSITERKNDIDVEYKNVRDCAFSRKVILGHCPTVEKAADPLTKPLDRVKHKRLMKMMGIVAPSFEGECSSTIYRSYAQCKQ